MVEKLLTPLSETVGDEIDKLLSECGFGTSRMSSVAYDTSWLVRAIRHFPGYGFEGALSWLRHDQHLDGSWGGEILHYHDRVICTLSSIIALTIHGDSSDWDRIRAGQSYLWRESSKTYYDADETIAYPLILTILSREAAAIGLDVPDNPLPNLHLIDRKLNALRSGSQMWRHSTITYSFEALSSHLLPDNYDFLEGNFSVATSPAATISLLLNAPGYLPEGSLGYVQSIFNEQGDGGMSTLSPFEIFESIWVLYSLHKAEAITPDHPSVRRMLDYLWKVWNPEKGVSFSYYYSVPDLDDTSLCFMLLRWGGYPVDAKIFAAFEEEDHFSCYLGEADPSWNTHIHLLTTLQTESDHPQYAKWIEKIIKVLRRNRRGSHWFDKWHISPYYPTCDAISTMIHFDPRLAETNIRWVLNTQQKDGGWGFYGPSTAEETAYCLLALLTWDSKVHRIDKKRINMAHDFLVTHINDKDIPKQWIGKCLYTPHRIVRATELAALHAYYNHER